ncbi:hypothetical protein ACH4UM_19140 [Streptomyces sp. NPDC020801]|uniref:hypothetical protein n=1 Tax=Streptomyces sp. NPDC020801 TaxID=3365093 RepID=UPI00379CB989
MDCDDVSPLEALLDEPVRSWRPRFLAAPSFRLSPFLVGDPPVELGEGIRRLLDHDSPGEVEQLESRRRPIVHMFDIRR